jgi:hypothetical protein
LRQATSFARLLAAPAPPAEAAAADELEELEEVELLEPHAATHMARITTIAGAAMARLRLSVMFMLPFIV